MLTSPPSGTSSNNNKKHNSQKLTLIAHLPQEHQLTTTNNTSHLPQRHQPEDLPDPHGDRHVRQPVEPVHQEGFRVRLPRLLERHAGEEYHFDHFDI